MAAEEAPDEAAMVTKASVIAEAVHKDHVAFNLASPVLAVVQEAERAVANAAPSKPVAMVASVKGQRGAVAVMVAGVAPAPARRSAYRAA